MAPNIRLKKKSFFRKPFGQLKHFRRVGAPDAPKLLIVAPMSGHFATLLRGTAERMLPGHDVYITDWRDAKYVPVDEGHFDLDDYIDYLIEYLDVIGPGAHMIAVCQPSVPSLGCRCADVGGKAPRFACKPDHDGRADRHALHADRGERSGNRVTAQLV